MAYARFSYADVYVFMNVSGHLECCGCLLSDQWKYDSTQAMVDHLAEHRSAGHDVPDGIEAELWPTTARTGSTTNAATLRAARNGQGADHPRQAADTCPHAR